jgi:AcrR family transcriptional regulator
MEHVEPERLFENVGRQGPPVRTLEPRESHEERLDRILEAATGVIAREGYRKASMRAIAGAAGVSLAGLYHYIEGKERILFLIQFRTFSSLLSNLREKLHGVDDPVERLRVMIRAHVSYFAANMAALKVCSHELDSLTGPAYEETRRIRRAYYELTRSIVDRVLATGPPNGILDRRIATMSLFGTLNWLYRWYDPKKGRSPSVLAAQISTQFLQGVLAAPPVPAGG